MKKTRQTTSAALFGLLSLGLCYFTGEGASGGEGTGTPAPATPAASGDAVATPAVVTPPVTPQTPAVATPAAPVVPDGYVKAEDVESERTARTAAEARATAAEARARSAEIRATAQALGFNDPSDAERFIAGDAADIEAALKEVIEKKSYLAKPTDPVKPPVTPTSPTNPARAQTQAPTFTQAQIADRAFYLANKDAIMLALREGRISG